MNYLIKWQFAKGNFFPFKSQAEIIISDLIPMVEDKLFLEKKFSFYITKVYFTNVRLAVFVEEKNLKELEGVVLRYTKFLKLNPVDPEKPNENNGWDGCPKETPFTFLRDTTDSDEIFYTKYLEDISKIGIDLHKKDLTIAVPVAVKAAYEIEPLGSLKPRTELEKYFSDNSEHYRNKSKEEIDRFWSNCGFYYKAGNTWGDHFYYNIVLGIDPRNLTCQNFFNALLVESQKYNRTLEIPSNLQCREAVALVINDMLKDNK